MKHVSISKREDLHRVKSKVKLVFFALLMILTQSGGSRHEPLEPARHHLPLTGCNKLETTGPRFPLVSAAGSSHSVLVIAPFS